LLTPARIVQIAVAAALVLLAAYDSELGGAALLRGAARPPAGADARAPCASAAAMTDGGRWSSPPNDDSGGRGDVYAAAGCVVAPAGFEDSGALCAELAERRLGALLFVGDSLAFNLEVDLRMNVFGETSAGLSRFDCWVGRHTYFSPDDRGICHDGAVCGGAVRISFVTGQRLSDAEGQMRSRVFGFLNAQPAGQRAAVVLWLGAHYVADRLPVAEMQADLAETLRFLAARRAAFPQVLALSPTYWFANRPAGDGQRPWNVEENATARYALGMRETVLNESGAVFLDMNSFTKAAGAVHLPDSVHPDELVNSYVIGMLFQLLRDRVPASPSPSPGPPAARRL